MFIISPASLANDDNDDVNDASTKSELHSCASGGFFSSTVLS